LEYYGTLDQVKKAFVQFCNTVPFYGYSILCHDDENTRSILPELECAALTYGVDEGAGLRAENIETVSNEEPFGASRVRSLRTRFDVVSHDARYGQEGKLGSVELRAIGRHNVCNALAACAVGLCLKMRFGVISEGLRHFDGVRRRMQLAGESHGVVVIEDYAHHPTEIAVTIDAARGLGAGRVVVLFQPHLYSRTKFLAEEFGAVLRECDWAVVTDIYASREQPIEGVDLSLVVDAAGVEHVEAVPALKDAVTHLAQGLQSGDVLLVLGAGDVNRWAQPLLEAVGARHG